MAPPLRPLAQLGCVSAQGLGCMGLTWAYASALEGSSADKESFLRSALERGVTLFNSANIYVSEAGHNEELIGRAFKDVPRSSYFLSTKFGIKLPEFVPDLKPEAVHAACDAALARFGVSYIDLFIVCRQDPHVPLEDTVTALKELIGVGKIRGYGLSEASAAQIKRAHAIHPVSAVEVEYSLFTRGIEAEILPTCRALGIAVLAYSPVGRGMLTGKLTTVADIQIPGPFMGKDFRAVSPRFAPDAFEANKALVERISTVAERKGVTTAQVALAWVHSKGDDIFPIPGTTKVKNLEENLGALEVSLTSEEVCELEAAIPQEAVVGARYHAHALAACHEAQPSE